VCSHMFRYFNRTQLRGIKKQVVSLVHSHKVEAIRLMVFAADKLATAVCYNKTLYHG
jgi:hypothetical protein